MFSNSSNLFEQFRIFLLRGKYLIAHQNQILNQIKIKKILKKKNFTFCKKTHHT